MAEQGSEPSQQSGSIPVALMQLAGRTYLPRLGRKEIAMPSLTGQMKYTQSFPSKAKTHKKGKLFKCLKDNAGDCTESLSVPDLQ